MHFILHPAISLLKIKHVKVNNPSRNRKDFGFLNRRRQFTTLENVNGGLLLQKHALSRAYDDLDSLLASVNGTLPHAMIKCGPGDLIALEDMKIGTFADKLFDRFFNESLPHTTKHKGNLKERTKEYRQRGYVTLPDLCRVVLDGEEFLKVHVTIMVRDVADGQEHKRDLTLKVYI